MSADEDETPRDATPPQEAKADEAAAQSTPPAKVPVRAAQPVRQTTAERLTRLRGSLQDGARKAMRKSAEAGATSAPDTSQPLPDRRAPAVAGAQPPARTLAQPPALPAPPANPVPAVAPPAPAGSSSSAAPTGKRPLFKAGRSRMSSSRAALLSMTSQEAPLAEKPEERDLLGLVEAVLMRLIGLLWLAGAVLVWGRLIGYGDGAPSMAWHDLGAAFVPTLVAAIIAPIVAVGLWLVSRWGGVVWAAAVALGFLALFAGQATPPFETLPLVANLVALLVLGSIAGVRAWHDYKYDH
ncbi:MAG: hypothetical protein AcusKO_08890 [Acuticoccus sp.]